MSKIYGKTDLHNISVPVHRTGVVDYRAFGNKIDLRLADNLFSIGECIDIDNEKGRITGQIRGKWGNVVRVQIIDIREKNVNYS